MGMSVWDYGDLIVDGCRRAQPIMRGAMPYTAGLELYKKAEHELGNSVPPWCLLQVPALTSLSD